nr:MAG TPA: hypothetical protein [Caudoviricetes sp.]
MFSKAARKPCDGVSVFLCNFHHNAQKRHAEALRPF